MSMPRCWPPAYGSSPSLNFSSTGPSTGHVHATAGGAVTSTDVTTTINARRIWALLVFCIDNEGTVAIRSDVVNLDYKDMS